MPSSRPWIALVGVGALLVVLATGVVALVSDDGPLEGWCDGVAVEDAEGASWGDVVVFDGRTYEAVADGDVEPAEVDASRILGEVACRGDGSSGADRVEATSLEPGTRLFPLRRALIERRIAAETDRGFVAYALVTEEVDGPDPGIVEEPDELADEVVVTAEDLGRTVAVEEAATDDDVVRLRVSGPDGSVSSIEVPSNAAAADLHWFIDRTGAAVWQWVGEDEASAVFRSTPDGRSMLWSSPGRFEPGTLVGLDTDRGRALIEARGVDGEGDVTADLIAVPVEAPDAELVVPDVAGSKSWVTAAASLEISLLATRTDEGDTVLVAPPDAEAVTVFRGAGGTAYAAGVGMTDDGRGIVLLHEPRDPELPRGRLLVIELHTGEVVAEHPVPLELGLEGVWSASSDLSVAGRHVLVNRWREREWLTALVFDTESGDWGVLDTEGRARLGPEVLPEPPPEPSGCGANDALLANAEPTPGALHLYLPCSEVSDVVHRTGTPEPQSGDPLADARAVLDRVYGPLDPELEALGYHNYSHTGIEVRGVTLDADGTLVVDLDFPDGGVNNLSASYAGYIYRLTLTANLLQIDGVDGVETWLDGSCEAHSAVFEGHGCPRFTEADAPWNTGRP